MGQVVISNRAHYRPNNGIVGSVHDLVALGFRRRRLICLSFLGVLIGTIAVAFLRPNRYESSMKILVKRDRMDPLVTSEAQSSQPYNSQTTEEQMNSEVELLRSRDLLEKVVVECGLQRTRGWDFLDELLAEHRDEASAERNQIARAVTRLAKELKSDVIRKSNLISVKFRSEDPALAERVVRTLGRLYLAKHIAVHRPPGTADFFKNETLRYRRLLDEAEARIAEFTRDSSVVSATAEKEAAIAKSTEFNAVLRQTQAAIAETMLRLQALNSKSESTPVRMTTQVRSSDDGKLLSDLRSNLLALEQKRTELLAKFEPGYRPVQQVVAQIEQTRAAITAAEKARLNEEVTDRNPTFDWIKQEQARSEAELAGLEARAKATETAARSYEERAQALEQKEIVQSDLVRTAKAAESNYLLYLRKEEEARVSDSLDQMRILNVAIAEVPGVPTVPVSGRLQAAVFGVLLAFFVSGGLALVADQFDSTFRTPGELEASLQVPVLGAIPSGTALSHITLEQRTRDF